MRSWYMFLVVAGMMMACKNTPDPVKKRENKTAQEQPKEQLIEQTREWYREYYPGKKQIKIIGTVDDEGRRHGVWEFYNESGQKISATYYLHGIKEGYSIVYHPNGNTSYVGEYKNDKKIGVWRTYDPDGNLISEKEFK